MAVVVDYQNIHLTGASLFLPGPPPEEGLIDPFRFACQLAQARNAKITDERHGATIERIEAFRGPPIQQDDPGAYRRRKQPGSADTTPSRPRTACCGHRPAAVWFPHSAPQSSRIGGVFCPGEVPVMDRVAVFVDYQNVVGWAKRCFSAADGHIRPKTAAELLVSRRRRPSQLVGTRVYRGRPNPTRQAVSARANDRQTADWEATGVTVIRRNLQYPPQWPDIPASEKGIDAAIASTSSSTP
ncbi:NYN domain-containing protein [Actinomyces gaoshouyii]|uniref:NYN domain-containing protein n=1 Tax=Actinomyces gaoshouyii TaxID=1960083 RepID=A0A8H9HC86_9ACTO|nr:NYN domain-containing protein [Actinomyces gaoshouyii]GGO99661.1 hypothetical protein GCM10011612_17460 [Actinomyces gaoshouyii]